MKNIYTLIIGSTLLFLGCDGSTDGDHSFYYSASQQEVRNGFLPRKPDTFINISGEWFLYTETVDRGLKPTGRWEDYEFLGHGFINKVRIGSLK